MNLKFFNAAIRSVISNLYFLRIIKDLNGTQRDTSIQHLRSSIKNNFPYNSVVKGHSAGLATSENTINSLKEDYILLTCRPVDLYAPSHYFLSPY